MGDDTPATHEAESADPPPGDSAGQTERAVVTGRRSETPFVLVGGVALVIWAVAALVAAGVLLLWWLA